MCARTPENSMLSLSRPIMALQKTCGQIAHSAKGSWKLQIEDLTAAPLFIAAITFFAEKWSKSLCPTPSSGNDGEELIATNLCTDMHAYVLPSDFMIARSNNK